MGVHHGFPALNALLLAHLVLVVLGEVVDNNGNWQGNHEHPANATQTANQLPRHRHGNHVTVAHGCHGDDGPPERSWNALKGFVVVLLGAVGEAGEHEDSDGHEEYQQTQLFVAPLQRVSQRLQAGGVPG